MSELESPLDEADAKSLEDIMNTDPLELTKQDRAEVVKYLRRARESFLKTDAAKVPRGAKNKPVPVKQDMKAELTLDDLDI